jgi:hypothetical protein
MGNGRIPTPDKDPPVIERPKCRATMTLIRILPKANPYPELQTFRCEACRHEEPREVK